MAERAERTALSAPAPPATTCASPVHTSPARKAALPVSISSSRPTDLPQIFTLQESRLITTKLTVNYKRGLYLLEDTVENRRLRRTSALVSEAADGTVTIRGNGRVLPYRLQRRDQAVLVPGVVVAHEHLDGAFAWIAAQQRARDAARLANPKITRRAKQRIQTAMAPG